MHPDTFAGLLIFGPFMFFCAILFPFLRGKP